jgi:predicted porin
MQNRNTSALALGIAITAVCGATTAGAVDLTTPDGAWKFSIDGNINVDYIYSSCQSPTSAEPIVTVGGACTGNANSNSTSNVGNGLLPAALDLAVATTQAGFDISAHFGLYPGIATNDGGSPNLQQTTPNTNSALGTTGLDVRQVYLTFGNKDIGTFTFGRNFGLFGFDAIITDMSLIGVGVAGSESSANPANTTLGSIGFGYIYTDTLAQMDYTTPDFSGFNATLGIFDPVNALDAAGSAPGTALPKKEPGVHGKLTYTAPMGEGMKLYFSGTFIYQKQDYAPTAAPSTFNEFTSRGYDVFGKFSVAGFEVDASYYHGNGMGTTALFVLADDGHGNSRESDGYLLQATYTIAQVKLGINYGVSKLDYANLADSLAIPNLLSENSKVTEGIYYSLTKNLTLLGEVSEVKTQAHNGFENKSTNANVGAFLAF